MRPVVLLSEAAEDIETARDFYESIETGLGDYFADSIITDLESLSLFHGIHAKHFGFHRVLGGRFPFGVFIMRIRPKRPLSLACSISEGIPPGSGQSCLDVKSHP